MSEQTWSWKPIETAPKDGQHVLLAATLVSLEAGWVAEGYFEEGHGWYEANSHWTDAYDGSLFPSHWTELPAPPLPTNTDSNGEG